MVIHVLIACSKSKSIDPEESLIWSTGTDIESWNQFWHDKKIRFPPVQLYTGRAFIQQIQATENFTGIFVNVISAGAGLIPLVEEIPAYEATFRKGIGPNVTEWHRLPHGGIERLNVQPGDKVVSFAPPQYHRALLNDPNIHSISEQMIVPSTSPLAPISSTVIQIHPRAKEVLGVGSADLNTEFLRTYLSQGIEGFKEIARDGGKLPPKVERTSISDANLLRLIGELEHLGPLTKLIRHLRDELGIKASVERISAAQKSLRKE